LNIDKKTEAKSVDGQNCSDRSVGKRKDNEKVDVITNKKSKDINKARSPTVCAASKYTAFFEVVVKGATKEATKVKCILCGDGRIFGYSSMWRHIKAIHTQPVQCDICGKEFNTVRLVAHKRKCHSVKVMEENNNLKSSDMKVDQVKLSQVAKPSPAPPTSLNAPISSPVSVSATHTNSVRSGKTKDDLPSLVGGYISLTMTSATKGVSLKLAVRKEARVKKAMKKFCKKFNVDYRSLTFLIGSHKLTGVELVAELEGREIYVIGDLPK